MSTDTRHPQYDDATLQAVMDDACQETHTKHPEVGGTILLASDFNTVAWPAEKPARLALARGLLARLPEPQPPTAGGKTPGQVCHESMYNTPEWKWLLAGDKAACEAAASAVLAAFGGAETLRWKESAQSIREQINAQQARAEKAEAELAMSEAAFSNYRGLILSTLNEVGAPTHHPDVGASARKPMTPQERIKALCGLSTLPPEAKAPAVEAGKKEMPCGFNSALDVMPDESATAATFTAHGKTWTRHVPGDPMPCDGEALVQIIAMGEHIHNPLKGKDWNWQHGEIIGWSYADEPTPAEPSIREVLDAIPVYLPAPPPWQPAVGEPVRLVSGGPVMTVMRPAKGYDGEPIEGEWTCMWATESDSHMIHAAPSCLVSAKEAQP